MLDGVFSALDDREVRFHEAFELSPEHVERLEATVQRRVLRHFARRGLLDEADADGMLTWQGSGGFSVDASVRIAGEDRAGLERDHLPTASGAPATAPGPRSRSSACTRSTAPPQSGRPRLGSSTASPSRTPTAAPSSYSPRSSVSSASHASSHPRAFTATDDQIQAMESSVVQPYVTLGRNGTEVGSPSDTRSR